MAHYVSVRGWIEFDTEFLPRIKQLVKDFATRSGNGIVTSEQIRLYSQGWMVSEDAPNWTKYCFYGADIRLDALDFLRAQVQEIAAVLVSDDSDRSLQPEHRLTGIFYIDDDEGEISFVWYITAGGITEKVHIVPTLCGGTPSERSVSKTLSTQSVEKGIPTRSVGTR